MTKTTANNRGSISNNNITIPLRPERLLTSLLCTTRFSLYHYITTMANIFNTSTCISLLRVLYYIYTTFHVFFQISAVAICIMADAFFVVSINKWIPPPPYFICFFIEYRRSENNLPMTEAWRKFFYHDVL